MTMGPRSSSQRTEEGTVSVLHVDDEPDFADLAAEFVERQGEGLSVETTTNVNDALDRIRTNGIDCVVSDYDMPDQSGIELLETVREECPDLPFILFTGKGSEEVASDAIQAGVTDYIQKGSGTSQYELLANRIKNAVEQHRAQEYAEETEHRLRTIAENTNDVLWKFSADWDELRFINSPYEEIWGRSIEELRERPQSFLDGIHPDDRDLATDAMAQISSGKSVDIECRVNADEDFGRWAWIQGEPVFDDDGEVENVVGFSRDITQRKERVEEIERLKDRFQAFTEFASDIITVVDETGHIQYKSPSVERVLGYQPEELIGTAAFEHVHPDDRKSVVGTFEATNGSSGSVTERVTYRFKHADGSWVWLESVGSNRTNNAINGYVINSRDITERTEYEGELRNRDHVLREMYEIMADRHRPFADQVSDLLELGRSELDTAYGTLSEIRGDEYVFEVVAADDDSIQAGDVAPLSATNCETVASTGDTVVLGDVERDAPEETDRAGYTEWGISCYIGAPVTTGDELYGTFCFYGTEARAGQFTEWEETLVDLMSRWVSYELQRQQVKDRLQAQNERLERFAGMVSHDLRNPLSVIQGSLELANETGEAEQIARASEAATRMEKLIQDLLSLARQGDDVAETEMESVEVDRVAERCWRNVQTDTASIRIESSNVIRANRQRLNQVFENLFRNAVEHGGKGVTVQVGPIEHGFYIEDDGTGISEEEREQVFETGYSTNTEGTGYGLSIVQRIVDAHDWGIHVTDGNEGGARFEITGVGVAADKDPV